MNLKRKKNEKISQKTPIHQKRMVYNKFVVGDSIVALALVRPMHFWLFYACESACCTLCILFVTLLLG